MKKLLAIAALSLGFTASVHSKIDLAQAIIKVDRAQTAIDEIPSQIRTIKSSTDLLDKLITVQNLLENLSSLSGPLAEMIQLLNSNKIISKFIPRQLVTGITNLNKSIVDAAGSL